MTEVRRTMWELTHEALRATWELILEAVRDAWALVQPIDCLGCGAPDRACCAACRAAIRPGAAARIRCDATLGVPVWCAADYAGPVRGAVLSLKEMGRVDAARVLAPLLRAAVAGAIVGVGESGLAPAHVPAPRRVELAPIPTTHRALARRGHDPLRLIVARARLPASRILLARRGWSAGEQKRRDRAGRLGVQAWRFQARGRLDGRAFILVDDLATTGATLAVAVAAIVAAGGTVLGCAVVAAPSFELRAKRGDLEEHPERFVTVP